ncbi:MAG: hypothetical protein A3G81_04000 [Betaproteobacteria bacterium RIFCSPLOWO2_12_FULL_65_14]|nr:MAG: hypothetical protein A3G81_04000 [Betaproteobacteria bacterium RIFCSPLOWO2_12_FULL_65_14]
MAVIAFLLKLWIDKRLTHALGQQLEKFKADLAKDVATHSIQQNWHHAKKMAVLEQLYTSIVDAEFELKALLMNWKIGKAEFIKDRANKFCAKYLEVNAQLHRNEIYLDQSLVDEIRSVYQPYFDLATRSVDSGSTPDELKALLPDTMHEIFAIGDGLRQQVVKRFRAEVGVNA